MAHRSLGAVLLITGHREESAVHSRKAAEIKLRATVESDPQNARARNDLGALVSQAGHFAEAVAQFREALALQPAFLAARVNLGEALLKSGQLEDALTQLRQALDQNPAYAPAHYALGLALNQRHDTEAAIREWQRTLELDPQYAEAHANLADTLFSQGHTVEALAHWREVIELRPTDAATLPQVAWVLATSPDAAIRNGEQAMALAVRAMQASGGKDAHTLDMLAAVYAERGDFENATHTARDAKDAAVLENQPELAARIEARYALYLSRQPFRASDRSTLGQ